MIYELREYRAAPGAVERLKDRFASHTFDLFARHGIEVTGFWVDQADGNRLVYLVKFSDETARDRAWKAFQADPDWLSVKKASEADGPLVEEQSTRLLVPLDL